ncbi:hypothetical protein BDK51DRAFT_49490 [Blyttiomyces helicus]|uniref:DNA-directed DNA polymerase n=1 Tax=Blyttiomyces helicus TaxID=388810 RepID=A0A4P9VYH9_9FUNG|nr:hypothetical protein BDK51DRAFT_49490 [Blyttiomyces helicus]|eukprot:RKO84015.1 hypothetical protein BDK51DRAFT_49490 [Blyttiomyces helicus]
MHNGFGYDIGRLAAHCSPKYSKLFMRVNLGKTSKGIDMAIPGCTVVDTWWFLHKLHGSDYESTSLASIAKKLGVEDKSKSPAMNVDPNDLAYNYTEMAVYNVQDANLCLQGATVLHPVKGLHHNVEVCHFNSLYPNIMISANTSVETVRAIDLDDPAVQDELAEAGITSMVFDGAVYWDTDNVVVRSGHNLVVVDHITKGVQPSFLEYLTTERSSIKRSAAGASTSGMGSVHTAATVTAIARWLIMLASFIGKVVGCKVLYGDTDSVFLKAASQPGSATSSDQPLAPSNASSTFVAIFHGILKHTPFTRIKFSHGKTYKSLILVKPKITYMDKNQFTLAEASLESKQDGIVYYLFVDDSGDSRMVPVDFDDTSTTRISRRYVLQSLDSALAPILDAVGIQNVADLRCLHLMSNNCL